MHGLTARGLKCVDLSLQLEADGKVAGRDRGHHLALKFDVVIS
jgi:hypothetical protein